MDKFDEKVMPAVKKLEAEGKVTIKDDKIYPAGEWAKKNEGLIDPMAFEESPEEMEKKKQKWMDIFMFHPEMVDRLINLNADKMLDRFWQWAKIYLDHNDFAENVILGLIDAYGDEVYESLLAIYDGKGSLGWAEKEENK